MPDAESGKDSRRISATRRQRGYHWENAIVRRFNDIAAWRAFRLGSSSVHLPDVLAVSASESSLFVIEAKSGTASSLRVPADQIERCRQWTDTFEAYERRRVVLAFKFLARRRVGTGRYESRKMREYFKEWSPDRSPSDCACGYDGTVSVAAGGRRIVADLPDCNMPFEVWSKELADQ